MRREHGFTLVELLISMTMFIFVIAAVSSVFAPLLTQFKQQSRMAETQIEGIIGLEILRRDIKHAGFGLPWNMNGGTYTEAGVDGNTDWADSDFNDGPPANPARGADAALASNPPGAIRSDNVGLFDSDVLVLKAANVAINDASQKWTLLGAGDVKRQNDVPPSNDDFGFNTPDDNTDRVIVISPGNSPATRRGLVLSSGTNDWRTTYNATSLFAPSDLDINIIYGIRSDSGAVSQFDPRMPFNRTEYYIRIPGTMPSQCAGGTGILYKSELIHSTGMHTGLEEPLLDCVADFQVGYTININGVPGIAAENYTNGLTAAEIRDRIRMVTVSILAQEGQKDPTNCTVANPCVANPIRVGPDITRGRDFNFNDYPVFNTSSPDNHWQNFRWKVYTITVTLENLG